MTGKLAIVMAGVAAGLAWGGEFYVSPAGDDANPGTTAGRPFRTIGRAAQVAVAGSVVNLAPGVYEGRVVLTHSGTAQAPVLFRKQGEGEAVWTMKAPDPPKWADNFALSLEGREYIILEGITFRDCAAWLFMFDASHVTVKDCVFDGSRIYNGIQLKNAGYNRFLNCRFLKAIPIVEWKKMSDWWHQPAKGADYIEIYFNSHHNLVEDCEFGEIAHVAVSVAAFAPGNTPRHNIIRHCTFREPVWKGIGTGAAEHTLIENNLFTGTAAMFIQLQSPESIIRRNLFVGYREVKAANAHENLHSAIGISSPNDRDTPCYAHHNRIYHNLFHDNDKCTSSFSWKGPVADNLFKNNIFFRNRRTVFLPTPDYAGANRNFFFANLMEGMEPGARLIELQSDEFTLAEAQAKLPGQYRDNVEADPLLSDPAAADYRLKPGSPAIDRGEALTRTATTGEGTGVAVEDARYFCDGWDLIEADRVVVGTNPPVRILKVDYERNVLTLERSIAWREGDPVSLPFAGAAPDLGPIEQGVKPPPVFGRRAG